MKTVMVIYIKQMDRGLYMMTHIFINVKIQMRLLQKSRHLFSIENSFKQQFLKPKFAQLTNRTLIIVSGPDAHKFLQGLTTNNIELLNPLKNGNNHRKIALYTLFLNPKGKIISDGLIIQPRIFEEGKVVPKKDQLWVEVALDNASMMTEHLRKYTWKKKVFLANLAYEEQKPKLFAGYTSLVMTEKQTKEKSEIKQEAGNLLNLEDKNPKKVENGEYSNVAFFDPRCSFLGIRIICGSEGFDFKGKKEFTTQQDYEKFTKTIGISSSRKMSSKLPFMFNADLFNGFAFRKGCYLGQQIISRAYYTGIVRRRIFPFSISSSEALPENTVLKDEDGTEIGKVTESYEGGGLVLSQYLGLIEREWPIRIKEPVEGLVGSPVIQDLREYVCEMRKKQNKLLEIDL